WSSFTPVYAHPIPLITRRPIARAHSSSSPQCAIRSATKWQTTERCRKRLCSAVSLALRTSDERMLRLPLVTAFTNFWLCQVNDQFTLALYLRACYPSFLLYAREPVSMANVKVIGTK